MQKVDTEVAPNPYRRNMVVRNIRLKIPKFFYSALDILTQLVNLSTSFA
jgi:hypothetical protein